jgi:hypothetical protein
MKPDPDLGWSILNEFADQLSDDQRGEFISDARLYEGAFTSGYVPEAMYRAYLMLLLPKDLDHHGPLPDATVRHSGGR